MKSASQNGNCDINTSSEIKLEVIIYCLQKRAVRAITNSDYRANSAPLFSKLKILDIYQINTFQIAKFMDCCLHCFSTCFFTKNQTHGYSARTANKYRIHHCRTNLKKIHNPLPRSKDLEFPPCPNYFFVKFSQL